MTEFYSFRNRKRIPIKKNFYIFIKKHYLCLYYDDLLKSKSQDIWNRFFSTDPIFGEKGQKWQTYETFGLDVQRIAFHTVDKIRNSEDVPGKKGDETKINALEMREPKRRKIEIVSSKKSAPSQSSVIQNKVECILILNASKCMQ